jgi:hypothetical protein
VSCLWALCRSHGLLVRPAVLPIMVESYHRTSLSPLSPESSAELSSARVLLIWMPVKA